MAHLVRAAIFVSCVISATSLKRGTQEFVALVTDFDGYIYRYDVNDTTLTRIPMSDRGQGPEAIDYDPVLSQIYWTNIRADTIKRVGLDGSNEEIVLRAIETPRGLAVDYINRLLFYTEEKIDIIARVNLTATRLSSTTVLTTGMDRPLAITLDMTQKLFYWTDIGSPPKIEKANYDGTNRTTLVRSGLKWPIALALDETRQKLFWCDGSVKKIQYINLVTNKITLVKYQYGTHYYDLNYVEGTIYFIDLLQRNAFQTISATGKGKISTFHLGKTLSKWRKIRVIKVTVCEDTTWGDNCTKNCGNCQNDAICNKWSGHCPDGCQTGYAKPTCKDSCGNGTYGYGCNSRCGHCHDKDTCDPVTGLCLYGCAAGWDGKSCTGQCLDGQHGRKCETICGHCLDGAVCDKQTGNCTDGCEPGWSGALCKEECLNGTFGVDCQYQCQCYDGSVCDKLTGQCPRENITVRTCPDDRYGFNCNKTCGQCANGQLCKETTGQCPGDCDPGWKGDKCQIGCTDLMYGAGCTKICACRGSEVCDGVSGKCYPGVLEPKKQVSQAQFSDTPLTASLCAVIVIMAILLAIAAVFIYRRKRLDKTASTSKESLSTEKEFSISFNTSHDRLITS